MTMPNEYLMALENARRFLRALLDPKQTPRIPRSVRREAYYALKHYPANYLLERLRVASPELLGDRPLRDEDGAPFEYDILCLKCASALGSKGLKGRHHVQNCKCHKCKKADVCYHVHELIWKP